MTTPARITQLDGQPGIANEVGRVTQEVSGPGLNVETTVRMTQIVGQAGLGYVVARVTQVNAQVGIKPLVRTFTQGHVKVL